MKFALNFCLPPCRSAKRSSSIVDKEGGVDDEDKEGIRGEADEGAVDDEDERETRGDAERAENRSSQFPTSDSCRC